MHAQLLAAAFNVSTNSSSGSIGFPLLTVIIGLPLLGGLIAFALPSSRSDALVKPIGAVVSAAELALIGTLLVEFKTHDAGFQFLSSDNWLSAFGIDWRVGVDGISLFLLVITAVLFPVAIFGPTVKGNLKSFIGWMLILEAACMGTFLSLDLFVFFIMFEFTLVPTYFLISGWGGLRRNYAAMKFFIFTFAGSAFLFVGIIALVFLEANHNGGSPTFNLLSLARFAQDLPKTDQELIFLAIAVGFAVKIPIVPFHSWLPDTYTEPSTGTSMILAGILFKLGAYGLLRFGVFMLPKAAVTLAPLMLSLAVVAITYMAIVTIMQKDFKRLIAYASIVDVAFIVIGLFGFTSQGVTGGVFEMVNHGLTTGAMFFVVGMIFDRTGTLKFSELGGLQKKTPILAGITIAVIMSAVGLPGLNGFVGEFLVLVGTFLTHRWWAVVAVSVIVTAAIYLLWAYQRVFTGPYKVAKTAIGDVGLRETVAIAPLLAGMVFLGVYPSPMLNRIQPSVDHLVAHVEAQNSNLHIPSGGQPVTYTVPASQVVDGGGH